jgi:hypothetical protein
MFSSKCRSDSFTPAFLKPSANMSAVPRLPVPGSMRKLMASAVAGG